MSLMNLPTPAPALNARRVSPLGPDVPPTKEPTVPKGVYPRKKKEPGATKPEPKPTKPRPAKKRKAKVVKRVARAPLTVPGLDWAVWSDGSVEIRSEAASGRLTADQVNALIIVVQRIKAAA